MKKYSNLELEVIALNNEDVLTASGGSLDQSKDPNGYCYNNVMNNSHPLTWVGNYANCVDACYFSNGKRQDTCDWYKGGMKGPYPW